jgi:hypothetical protein
MFDFFSYSFCGIPEVQKTWKKWLLTVDYELKWLVVES